MGLSECWTDIGDQRIRYLRAGSGQPLLLIHGLLGGSFCWRSVLPELAQNYSVHAVDLPGAGLSEDQGIDCSMSSQAKRLAELIERLAWEQAIVVGSSFGGAVAMLLAGGEVQTRGRISSLVLSSPVNPWSNFGRGRVRLLSSRLGGCFLRLALPISRPAHRIALRRMYGDPGRIPEGAVEGYGASILRPGRAENVLTALRRWHQDVELLRSVIPQLTIPTLLIWGTSDRAVDPRSAYTLRQQLPASELKLIRGAGHLPFEEAPKDFNRAVLEFLAKS
jgi:pimeloyl-ACP methyl ester carboxylesterase